MRLDRRQILKRSVMVAAAVASARGETTSLRIGMCDWNLGKSCRPEDIPRAKEVGIQGIQVSLALDAGNVPLRDPSVRKKYLELGARHGIEFNSVAIGTLNQVPLKSEPQAAILVIDALEAAASLGAKNVLLAFFGDGDLRLADAEGKLRNVSKSAFKSYELDTAGVNRVVDALKQIVPRAEALGVVLGIENTLTAVQNLDILQRIGSPIVQVYYDVGNSTEYGYDIVSEIRLLGNERICEIHLKDWKTPLLGDSKGAVNFPAAAEACKAIGFNKWYVLETSGREGKFLEDTRANIEFVRRLFG